MSIAQHLPLADHIIILDEKGGIAEQGAWEDLRAGGGGVSKTEVPKERVDCENEARGRDLDNNRIRSPPEQSDSKMQDIARKTGDFTLYSTLLMFEKSDN